MTDSDRKAGTALHPETRDDIRDFIRQCIARGDIRVEYIDKVVDEFSVSDQTARRYAKDVLENLKLDNRFVENFMLNTNLAVERLLHIYRSAMVDKKYGQALSAAKELHLLQGVRSERPTVAFNLNAPGRHPQASLPQAEMKRLPSAVLSERLEELGLSVPDDLKDLPDGIDPFVAVNQEQLDVIEAHAERAE